jgi:hypothetical protein
MFIFRFILYFYCELCTRVSVCVNGIDLQLASHVGNAIQTGSPRAGERLPTIPVGPFAVHMLRASATCRPPLRGQQGWRRPPTELLTYPLGHLCAECTPVASACLCTRERWTKKCTKSRPSGETVASNALLTRECALTSP